MTENAASKPLHNLKCKQKSSDAKALDGTWRIRVRQTTAGCSSYWALPALAVQGLNFSASTLSATH